MILDKIERIKKLIKELNNASYAYYNQVPIMSDYEWDKMYDELVELEKETGIVFGDSPTHNVGYTVVDELKEVQHNHPMLSLGKTKSIDELIQFMTGNYNNYFLSVKCDGLTTSLRYLDGKLVSAETRGDGVKGQDVLQNVLTIKNVPKEIPYKNELIIDGETIIGWDTFRKINDKLPEDKKYKHPRNLVSGSLQLLDSKEATERDMRFIAWRVIKGFEHKTPSYDLTLAKVNGFEIVPHMKSTKIKDKEYLSIMLNHIRETADSHNIPYDGAVMAVDNYELAESMGRTDKFFRHSIAYKYEDELFETVLTNIEWNTSKTGLINPVAVFQPVDLNGAITTRATLHNITYIKDMMLGIGDRIRVYRSNMVIPKVHDSIDKSGNFIIPIKCPICGALTQVIKENDSEVLMCTNGDCKGRLLGKLSHAASRNALNIEGLSETTIEKFIDLGWLTSIKSIYYLADHRKEMEQLDGFGKKSVEKLLRAIDESRVTTFDRFLYALSIPMVGKTASKLIAEKIKYNFDDFMHLMKNNDASYFSETIDGIGESIANSLNDYFDKHFAAVFDLATLFEFKNPIISDKLDNSLGSKVFVITGNVNYYVNRDALKADIEAHGGKVSGSISSKTSYLINNDVNSTSSKNQKAKSLNIPIISEEQFLSMI